MFGEGQLEFIVDSSVSPNQDKMSSTVDYLKRLAWKIQEDEKETPRKPTETARIIFTDPIVSDFLIHSSRLAVFSKQLAKSFRGDLDSLTAIKQLKFFYNLPTVAVLQQLTKLVAK